MDSAAIEEYGIPGPVLMERAGMAVASWVLEHYAGKRVVVFAGSGNNGGDGLVVARELRNAGVNVLVVMAGKRGALSTDCSLQMNIARKLGIPVEYSKELASSDLHGSVLVDALFGTGLGRNITGPLARTIETVNESSCPVVSIDIPSGINADTGQVMGAAFRAEATVTMGRPKRGLILHPGAEYAGELLVDTIGFPDELFDDVRCRMISPEEAEALIPERQDYSYKGDYGHVLVVAGSTGKTGAALLASRGALRYGAGMVTLGVPEALMDVFQGKVVEEMTLPLASDGHDGVHSAAALEEVLEFLDTKVDVLALGPGLGTAPGTQGLVRELVIRCTAPMVIDADGLNALAGKTALLGKTKAPVVLTPHPGEFARLTGTDRARIEANRVEAAVKFAVKTGTYVVFKGVPTVVAEPGGYVFLNPTGNSGMATAGAGDVLTGIIAAFLAQGLGPLEASVLGVYVHGLAGDLAVSGADERSLIASDLVEAAPIVFRKLRGAS